ncbi:hypothetical protein I8752_03785 [Nostocaceae cyanobacterium CENA369]|uniref:Uncharacterized protein n=1 Tax=Dendronalium phyllosphericum CENA369 TaxID=1725256 RepID=A0A8J7I249_9NOST|nr:hypothetical protein [Dendronalium phyllosphericum]MBH8572168.1 hypothetical protein [Dendronalium phyllosphericum CENA369]
MTQPSILELAKQGDAQAIASTINYLFKHKGIIAKAFLKDVFLQIVLESEQVPEKESSVALIHKLMMKLQVKSIKSVKIYGKKTGQHLAVWVECLNFTSNREDLQKNLNPQSNPKAIVQSWPAWIPYPHSWYRTFVLIPFIALIVILSFKFTGFWGFILSAITNKIEILFIFLVLGILLPLLSVAYIHSFWLSLWKKQSASPHWPQWLPNPTSLWEGFYSELVFFLSLLVTIVILLPFLPLTTCDYPQLLAFCNIREAVLNYYIQTYYIDKIALFIWIFAAAYLYQAEYLFRRNFIPKIKSLLKKYQSKRQSYRIDKTDVYMDKLRGDMGITQMNKGKIQQTQMTSFSQYHNQNTKKPRKQLLILFLMTLISVGIYLFYKLPNKQEIPVTITSKIPVLPSEIVGVTPSTVTSELSSTIPKTDNFREAVNQAISAANLTQSAKSQDEWKIIVNKWKTAIALMKTVPDSSANYAIAQQKVIEYQRNLNYAEKNAVGVI